MKKPWEYLPKALWDTPRAQQIWKITFLVMLLVLPLSLEIASWVRKSHNDAMAEVIEQIQSERAILAERKARAQGIAGRYANPAPAALGGFIEQEAKRAEVQLTDSTDRAATATGKIYSERHTVVRAKKTGIVPLLMMLEGIEQSGHPVTIPRLNLRKRGGEPDAYDIELGVSAYDRTAKPSTKVDDEESP